MLLVAVLLRLLEIIHHALTNDYILTKRFWPALRAESLSWNADICRGRDIFYKDQALFKKQDNVDRAVDDIAFSFGVPRSSLNVVSLATTALQGPLTLTSIKVATAKGLAAGGFKVFRSDGTVTDGNAERGVDPTATMAGPKLSMAGLPSPQS